jgi:hypothetical protein
LTPASRPTATSTTRPCPPSYDPAP